MTRTRKQEMIVVSICHLQLGKSFVELMTRFLMEALVIVEDLRKRNTVVKPAIQVLKVVGRVAVIKRLVGIRFEAKGGSQKSKHEEIVRNSGGERMVCAVIR